MNYSLMEVISCTRSWANRLLEWLSIIFLCSPFSCSMLIACNDTHWLLVKCKISEIHSFVYCTKWRKKKRDCFIFHDVKDFEGFYITADVSRFVPCKFDMLMLLQNVLISVYSVIFYLYLFFKMYVHMIQEPWKIIMRQSDWNTGFKLNTEICVLIKVVCKYILWILRWVLLICLTQ